MGIRKIVSGGAVALALAISGVAIGPAAHAQQPDVFMLRGPGSYIGASIRDAATADSNAGSGQAGVAGVVIENVRPDSPAAQAGLRESDVVVEFDGERVRGARQFTRLVQETPPGRTVTAVVLRGGQRTNVSITPVAGGRQGARALDRDQLRDIERKVEEAMENARENMPRFEIAPNPRAVLGLRVQELTPELAAHFGAKDGVLVASVQENSAARKADVRVGDVITSVNGQAIQSGTDLQRQVRAGRAGRDQQPAANLTLGVVREKREMSIEVALPANAGGRAPAGARTRPITL
jgi:serine protease Do